MTTTPNDAVGGRKMEEGRPEPARRHAGPKSPLTVTAEPSAARRVRAPELETLEAWADLDAAIRTAECALPYQMSEAMRLLVAQRERFNDLMLGRPPLREVGEPDERAAGSEA